MKKNYYVRYYQTYDEKQNFEQFLRAIASTGLRLHSVTQREFQRYDETEVEYTTIWEIDSYGDYLLLENRIADALKSRQFNNR